MQTSISGLKTACPCEFVNLCINIPPGITSPTFEWQVSSNSSFSNAPVFSTSICTQISVPCTLSQSKFVKATLINSNGQSVSVYTTLRASTCPPSTPSSSAYTPSKKMVCYPNPSSSLTNIGFTTSVSEEASLNLYDSNGKIVKSILNNSVLDSGEHNIEFTTEHLQQGIYYIHLNTFHENEVQKLIIIK